MQVDSGRETWRKGAHHDAGKNSRIACTIQIHRTNCQRMRVDHRPGKISSAKRQGEGGACVVGESTDAFAAIPTRRGLAASGLLRAGYRQSDGARSDRNVRLLGNHLATNENGGIVLTGRFSPYSKGIALVRRDGAPVRWPKCPFCQRHPGERGCALLVRVRRVARADVYHGLRFI